MQQLSELDASFLYMEQPSAPMHTCTVYVLNCSELGGPLAFDTFCSHVQARLHKAPRLRQRLVEVPLHLDHPYWADDPEFQLKNHLHHVELNGTQDQDELLVLATEYIKTPLRRTQPLWEMTLVTGLLDETNLPECCCAILTKIHHSAVDGVTGDELMSVLLDFSQQESQPTSAKDLWRPKPLPSRFSLMGNVYGSALNTPFRLANLAKDTAASAFYGLLIQRLQRLPLPAALFSAPRTPFNQSVSPERSYGYFEIPLPTVKTLKQSTPGITLNDLIMVLCSEVIRRHLDRSGAPVPAGPLIALSPLSVRSKHIDSPTGSQLSAMLLSLATDEPDLAVRLKRIHDNARASNVYSQAISANRLTRLIPSKLLGLAARVYTGFLLAQHHKPLFNLPITNIPGPKKYLYFAGTRVDYLFPLAPLYDGIGLVIIVTSYADKITLSFTSCSRLVPNMEGIVENCGQVLEELKSALAATDLNEIEDLTEEKHPENILTALVGDMVSLFRNMFSSPNRHPDK